MIENVNRFHRTLSNMDMQMEFTLTTNTVLFIFLDTANFYLHSNPVCMCIYFRINKNGSAGMLLGKIGLVIDALFCVNYSIWKRLFLEIIESLFQNIRHTELKGIYWRFFFTRVACKCDRDSYMWNLHIEDFFLAKSYKNEIHLHMKTKSRRFIDDWIFFCKR